MRWRHYGVCRDKIIRLPQVVGIEQHETHESAKHHDKAHYILDRVVSVEGDLIRIPVYSERIVSARGMQQEDV